jgi:hypothetical protein
MEQNVLLCRLAAWGLSVTAVTLAFVAWGQDNLWKFGHLSTYQIFPVLGLTAWSLMWSHYMAATVRQLMGLDIAVLKSYFRWTSLVVLVLICLHPGLLIYQRFRDGHGLPPGSYESYVAPGKAWITLLGTAGLLVFLAYELHRWYGRRSWWRWVARAGDIAMLAIFYHGLRLGSQLSHQGWFVTLWWFYGLSLVLVLIRNYYLRFTASKAKPA